MSEKSVCIYFLTFCVFFVGKSSVSTPQYTDWTNKTDVRGFGMISCRSSGFPPTNIVWKKNNIPLSMNDSNKYRTMQIITSRVSSVYTNVLILNDVLSSLGNHTYTCSISNSVGTVSRHIQLSTTGIVFYPVQCIYMFMYSIHFVSMSSSGAEPGNSEHSTAANVQVKSYTRM